MPMHIVQLSTLRYIHWKYITQYLGIFPWAFFQWKYSAAVLFVVTKKTRGGFICTFSLSTSLSITLRTSKFGNQLHIFCWSVRMCGCALLPNRNKKHVVNCISHLHISNITPVLFQSEKELLNRINTMPIYVKSIIFLLFRGSPSSKKIWFQNFLL